MIKISFDLYDKNDNRSKHNFRASYKTQKYRHVFRTKSKHQR